jgi:hypothetical protein
METVPAPEIAPKKLSSDDPVDAATLGQLGELNKARQQIGVQLLDLEHEKMRLMMGDHNLQRQEHRLYEKILLDRGLTPNAQVEIDSTTGKITILAAPKPEAPTAPAT